MRRAANFPGFAFLMMGVVLLLLQGWGHIAWCAEPAQGSLRLVVPEFPPYTFAHNGKIGGTAIRRIQLLMNEAQLPFQLEWVPNYGRALEQVRSGRADGFFLASRNAERDQVAEFSAPVTLNRWCWFLRTEQALSPEQPDFKRLLVATQLNTNTHRWLLKHHFPNIIATHDPDNLPLLLLRYRRVDAVLLAEEMFFEAAAKDHLQSSAYRKLEQSAMPFGIYISKQRLAAQPDLMQRLNAAIQNHPEPL